MYNYMQPIMASTVAIILGMGSFNIQKVIAVVLVFSGVYIVTQSKSRRDMLREGKKV
jgi:drug/metabolite transporter (DMT)-like permease